MKDCSECPGVWLSLPDEVHKCSHEGDTMDLLDFPIIPEECPLKK